MATAQADFRSNDRDGNGKPDYWRGDVAGLYTLVAKDGTDAGKPIRLIEISIALADDRAVGDLQSVGVRNPKAGYWFRALKFPEEKMPDPDRFAACAFPGTPAAGRTVYVVSHENRIHQRPFKGGPPPEVYPDPETLKREWSLLD